MSSQKEVNMHIRQRPVCKELPKPIDDPIHREDREVIRENRPPGYRLKNTEEKWTMLYQSLFPEDKWTPSPCKLSLSSVATKG